MLTFRSCSMRSASSLARSNSLLIVKEYFSGTLLFHVTDRGDFGLPPFLLGLLLPNKHTHTISILCNQSSFLHCMKCTRKIFVKYKIALIHQLQVYLSTNKFIISFLILFNLNDYLQRNQQRFSPIWAHALDSNSWREYYSKF